MRHDITKEPRSGFAPAPAAARTAILLILLAIGIAPLVLGLGYLLPRIGRGGSASALVALGSGATVTLVAVHLVSTGLRPALALSDLRRLATDLGLVPGGSPRRRGRSRWLQIAAAGVGGGVLDIVIVAAAAWLVRPEPPGGDPRSDLTTGVSIPVVVLFVVLAAAAEELVFRAPLLVVWSARPSTPLRAVAYGVVLAVSVVAFGLFHAEFGWWNVATGIVTGVIATAAAVWTRSLWAGLLVHTVYNLPYFLAAAGGW